MARNLYSVSPGERPVLLRLSVEMNERVVFVGDETDDPYALVVADSEDRAYEIGAPLLMPD